MLFSPKWRRERNFKNPLKEMPQKFIMVEPAPMP